MLVLKRADGVSAVPEMSHRLEATPMTSSCTRTNRHPLPERASPDRQTFWTRFIPPDAAAPSDLAELGVCRHRGDEAARPREAVADLEWLGLLRPSGGSGDGLGGRWM